MKPRKKLINNPKFLCWTGSSVGFSGFMARKNPLVSGDIPCREYPCRRRNTCIPKPLLRLKDFGLRKLSLQGKSFPQAECMHSETPATPRRRGNLYVARRRCFYRSTKRPWGRRVIFTPRTIEPVALSPKR